MDVASESLGALRFASRASKVKVVAKVSKYQDYESLYKEMKERFELVGQQQEKERNDEVFKQNYLDIISSKNQVIEQQGLEIANLQCQLALYRDAAASSAPSSSIHSRSATAEQKDPLSESRPEQYWLEMIETLKTKHARELDTLKIEHSTSQMKYQQSELRSKQELVTAQVTRNALVVIESGGLYQQWTCMRIGPIEGGALAHSVLHAAATASAGQAL